MRIGVTYTLVDDNAAPFDVPEDFNAELENENTITGLCESIQGLGHSVTRIGGIEKLVEFLVKGDKVDLIFNIAEGIWGNAREAQIPAILDAYRIPYTFSDPVTLAICLDKSVTKRLWLSYNLPTAPFIVLDSLKAIDLLQKNNGSNIGFPLFVKPLREGSSKGVSTSSVVYDFNELRKNSVNILQNYHEPVIAEKFLEGREFTVAVLGNGAEAKILGAMEINVTDNGLNIYGYEQKEEYLSRVTYQLVTETELLAKLSTLALSAYHSVKCLDAGRVDIRLDNTGVPFLLEINPLPGLDKEHSDLPIIGRMVGCSYEAIIASIIDSASARYSLQ